MILKLIRRFGFPCTGCGIGIQHKDPLSLGYMPLSKYKNILLQNEKAQQQLEELRQSEAFNMKDFAPQNQNLPKSMPYYKRERKEKQEKKRAEKNKRSTLSKEEESKKPHFVDVNSVDDLELLSQHSTPLHTYSLKPKIKPLVCTRCFQLSKYGAKTQVQQGSPEDILNSIFSKMKNRSVILYLVDLIDFNGSFIKEIYNEAMKKEANVILIANKIDALPKDYKYSRIHSWVKQQMQGLFDNQKIAVVSSKTGEGFGRILYLLKQTKSYKTAFYVVGSTNSGKSSFLNKLVRRTWNLPDDNLTMPILANELTTSDTPGTTLEEVPVRCRSLDITIIDTPGIPTLSQYIRYADPISACALVPSKKIKPLVVISHPGDCFWIGSLARIQMISGDFKYLTFFMSHLVTVHKTKNEFAEDVYSRQTGKLLVPKIKQLGIENFRKIEVSVDGISSDKASKDLVFHGLGWVSVTGLRSAKFEVYLPENIGFNLREPLMPFEATPDRAQKHKSKTYNIEHWIKKFKNNIIQND